MSQAALDAAMGFVRVINGLDADAVAERMTPDHVFIDSLGNRMEGRDVMREGWRGYYRMVPDYRISVEEAHNTGDVVVMVGTAQGTYSTGGVLREENRWSAPAAWRAVIRDGLVAEFRVYCDNEPIRQIMARNK